MDVNIGRFILQCVGIVLPAILFAIIKFNDLKHLFKSVEEIKVKQEEHSKEIQVVGERVAKLEGMLSVRNNKRKR